MHLGLPSLVSSDPDTAATRTILSEYAPSHEFAIQVRIQLAVASFSHIMSNNTHDEIDSSLVRMLDSELDSLKESWSDCWSDMAEMGVLSTKLHFYSLAITRVRPGSTARNILLKLGLGVSLRIAHLANARLHKTPPDTHGLTVPQRQRAHPKNYFRALSFAMVFLLRYFSLDTAAHVDEQQMAANHVKAAHHVFQTCAAGPQDEYGRVATLFETLGRQDAASADAARAKLAADHRMGVSILFDAVSPAPSEAQTMSTEIEEEWEARASMRAQEQPPMQTTEVTVSAAPANQLYPLKQEPSYQPAMMPGEMPADIGVSGVDVSGVGVSSIGVSSIGVSGVSVATGPWLGNVPVSNTDSWNDSVWDMFSYQGGYPQQGPFPPPQ